MYFEIVGEITNIETIAVGSAIRDIARLRKRYGPGRWRKLKGFPRFGSLTAGYVKLKSTGMKHMASVKSDSKSKDFWVKNYEATQKATTIRNLHSK